MKYSAAPTPGGAGVKERRRGLPSLPGRGPLEPLPMSDAYPIGAKPNHLAFRRGWEHECGALLDHAHDRTCMNIVTQIEDAPAVGA